MNVLLASTSSLFGGKYLEYIKEEIAELFSGIDEIIFIPFARPSGISHEEYTQIARNFFEQINIKVKGLHEFEDKIAATTAKSIAGSSTEIPPVTFKKTSLAPSLKPALFSKTARIMLSRLAL